MKRLGLFIMLACFLLSLFLWWKALKPKEKELPTKGIVKYAGKLHIAEREGVFYKIIETGSYVSEGYFLTHLK